MRLITKGYIWIIVAVLFVLSGIYIKYKEDIRSAQNNYIQEQHYRSLEVVKEVEDVFRTIYEGLRIITRLPGVKNIDRYAQNFDINARHALKEIYNNIANNVALSEIYIVPLNFNPDRIDEITQTKEEPIIMLDDLIVGRTALSKTNPTSGGSEPTNKIIEEIEIFEYYELVNQLTWMQKNVPSEDVIKGFNVPAIIGPEILTCDNTYFNPESPNDKDRSGIVYSLPFYDLQGKLKGSVSGIILSNVLRKHLTESNYVLRNNKHNYSIGSGKTIGTSGYETAKNTVYSELLPVNIMDVESSWQIFASVPDDVFYSRTDVVMAKQFAILGVLGVLFLTGGILYGYVITQRHNRHLETVNRELTEHQSLLDESRRLLKKFAGFILSVREEEKKRLSRELHDSVGSMAISLNAHIKIMEDYIKDNKHKEALEQSVHTKQMIKKIVGDFKKIAVNLRPPQLEVVGLTDAVQDYCEKIIKNNPIELELNVDINDKLISDEISIAIYRIAQEALTNTIKHAQAKNVSIRLFEKDDQVVLVVRDDGIGFELDEINHDDRGLKMGILGMHERIESYNGELNIKSSYGNGTTITVKVPFNVYELEGSLA